MAIQIKHAFMSLKGDGGDATLVRPSNWNAAHTTSMASGNVLGRLTAGAGSFEEIPLSAYMAALLAAADNGTLAGMLGIFETGDCKFTFRTTATAGWVLMLGGTAQASTIGSAGSGALLRANADTLNLYTIIWNACDNTIAPIYDSGGSATTRGANPAADFAANKRLTIPNPVGNAIVGAGAASTNGTTARSIRTLGSIFGGETVTLGIGEIPSHNHGVNDPGHTHTLNNGGSLTNTTPTQQLFGAALGSVVNVTVNSAFTGISIQNTGGGGAHANVQPSVAMNIMVKL